MLMTEVIVDSSIVKKDYPDLYNDFIEELRRSKSVYNKINEGEIIWYYYWKFDDNKNSEIHEFNKNKMLFGDRLEYEIERIYMEVYMKAKTYIRGDVPKNISNYIIEEQVKPIVIGSMLLEQRYYNDEEILNSIPDINNSLVDEILNNYDIKGEDEIKGDDDYELNLNSILDKINDKGYESLTEREINYLKSKSSDNN